MRYTNIRNQGVKSMYKVLIADDEVKVCKLIHNLIEWDKFGLDVIGMVHDGVSALWFIKEKQPDIVITDIRMPGYDGIELIKQAKEISQDIDFIIVSGYRHFDYAHNAIKYGVEDYLLKPLKKIELESTLTKMVDKYRRISEGQNEKDILKKRIDLDERLVKENFLDKLLYDQTIIQTDQFCDDLFTENLNELYHCDFIDGIYQGVIVKPDITVGEEDEQSYYLLMEKTKDITRKYLDGTYHEVIITTAKEGILCLLNDSIESMLGLKRQLKLIRNDIIKMRDVFIDVRVTIGIGEAVMNVKEIPSTILGARAAILNRLIEGTGHILIGSVNRSKIQPIYTFLDNNFRTKLLGYLETLNMDGVSLLIAEILEIMKQAKNTDGEFIYDVSKEIYDVYYFGITKNFAEVKSLLPRREFDKYFYMCDSLDEVFKRLTDTMVKQINHIKDEKKYADKKPIRIAKQYIKSNYQKSLTLEEVSNEIGFNPAYFSTLFKKETGQNFIEYLTDTRIQAAKQLLADTERSVIQVAEEVGYTDIKHFTKIFKKVAGLTPTEYRKLYY
jgi:two-component system, response regulator YesN